MKRTAKLPSTRAPAWWRSSSFRLVRPRSKPPCESFARVWALDTTGVLAKIHRLTSRFTRTDDRYGGGTGRKRHVRVWRRVSKDLRSFAQPPLRLAPLPGDSPP